MSERQSTRFGGLKRMMSGRKLDTAPTEFVVSRDTPPSPNLPSAELPGASMYATNGSSADESGRLKVSERFARRPQPNGSGVLDQSQNSSSSSVSGGSLPPGAAPPKAYVPPLPGSSPPAGRDLPLLVPPSAPFASPDPPSPTSSTGSGKSESKVRRLFGLRGSANRSPTSENVVQHQELPTVPVADHPVAARRVPSYPTLRNESNGAADPYKTPDMNSAPFPPRLDTTASTLRADGPFSPMESPPSATIDVVKPHSPSLDRRPEREDELPGVALSKSTSSVTSSSSKRYNPMEAFLGRSITDEERATLSGSPERRRLPQPPSEPTSLNAPEVIARPPRGASMQVNDAMQAELRDRLKDSTSSSTSQRLSSSPIVAAFMRPTDELDQPARKPLPSTEEAEARQGVSSGSSSATQPRRPPSDALPPLPKKPSDPNFLSHERRTSQSAMVFSGVTVDSSPPPSSSTSSMPRQRRPSAGPPMSHNKALTDSSISSYGSAVGSPTSRRTSAPATPDRTSLRSSLTSIQHQQQQVASAAPVGRASGPVTPATIRHSAQVAQLNRTPPDSDSSASRRTGSVGSATTQPTTDSAHPFDDETPMPPRKRYKPRFELAVGGFPRTILARLIAQLAWADVRSLRETCRATREALDLPETKERVLDRYMSEYGYRAALNPTSTSGSLPVDLPTFTLHELDAFLIGVDFAPSEYAELAAEHRRRPLDVRVARMIRASTRAYSKLVIRIRAQFEADTIAQSHGLTSAPEFIPRRRIGNAVFRDGRSATLRVWVPLRQGAWMQDDEVVACERELWRSGIWTAVRKADVVWNVAAGDFGNEGKLISDSKFLRDLAFNFDAVGHIPPWLNAMAYPPGFWHNVIASSNSNPVIYLDLSAYLPQIRTTLSLCKDNVEVASPQGRFRVQRYVYRAVVTLRSGTIIANTAGTGGSGPGGLDVIHSDWEGQLVVETEGTTEHAEELVRRCSPQPAPVRPQSQSNRASTAPTKQVPAPLQAYRVVRERSRPGKLVVKPLLDSERIA